MLHAVVLTQYRRVTDGRTDRQTDGQTYGIAIASTALAMRALRRAVKRRSITLNKNSARAFQRGAKRQLTGKVTGVVAGFPKVLRRPQFPQNGDGVPKFVVFWTISTIKDEKSAAKFHYIKSLSSKVVAQSIAFRVVSLYWQGDNPFP